MTSRHLVIALGLVLVGTLLVTTASAQKTQTVYNTIPKQLPGNVASEGPEAYAFAELGDGLGIYAPPATLGRLTVVMSSWACETGTWQAGCVTSKNATFSQPLTFNVYSVTCDILSNCVVGARLSSITQTFDIPYRPSATPAKCTVDPSEWYNSKEKACYHGVAVPVAVDFSSLAILVPDNHQIVLTVAFNTTHYGLAPIGESAPCYGTLAGCPYDSLNISTDTTNGTFPVNPGYPLDRNGIFVNYTLPTYSCSGSIMTRMVEQDTPCWTGYHPEITLSVNLK